MASRAIGEGCSSWKEHEIQVHGLSEAITNNCTVDNYTARRVDNMKETCAVTAQKESALLLHS